ncbi:MAG: tRNA uridine-5-carboxymethylaminomethyl(34) synthesis GTPase MnmE [Candidatus Sericytochromatia bacterium]|nr:tRNA uridine-5-carboxymethylaminomethyl(34) synthesis GTPase MnmE [Candidatus Sericytochromatia bacterium]
MWTTIAAIATPPGVGGVAIVRVSGPEALAIARSCVRLRGDWQPRHAHFGQLLASDGTVVDEGLILWLPGPGSYTGEDTVEFQGHGGAYVTARVLDRFIEAGADLALAGEFTRRAVINGKLDLTQAEAVGDLIAARTAAGAQQAMSVLAGGLTAPLKQVRESLMTLVAHLEAGIDFPDEVETPSPDWFHGQVATIVTAVRALIATSTAGQIYRHGATVALVGRPNVGKSSLLNALLRHERAIVTPYAGTTRDTLAEACDLDGLLVQLVDTAGIREADDPVERLGIDRSRAAMAEAMLTVLVVDGSVGLTGEDTAIRDGIAGPYLIVANKADVGSAMVPDPVPVWALTGDGLPGLEATLRARLVTGLAPPTLAAINARHRACLVRALENLDQAVAAAHAGLHLDCLTIDLRAALQAVSDVSGDSFSESVLDEVFGRFCVGK